MSSSSGTSYLQGVAADDPMLWYQGAGLSNRHWLHTDKRGSIVSLMDDSGNVVAINSYDEYGIPGSANSGRFQYTGQAWLSEIGMYYYKARIYSPTLGRFLQTDPVGYTGGVNLYEYAGDDPLDEDDPTGLLEKDEKPQDRSCQTGAPNGACSPFGTSYPGGAPTGNEAASRPQWQSHPDPGRAEDDEIDDAVLMGFGAIATVGEAGIAEGASTIAQNAGGHTVYVEVVNGVTRYVGMTSRTAARAAEHLRKARVIQPLVVNLSREAARATEQAFIEMHGLEKEGGTLADKINSIARSNPAYKKAQQLGTSILKELGYP